MRTVPIFRPEPVARFDEIADAFDGEGDLVDFYLVAEPPEVLDDLAVGHLDASARQMAAIGIRDAVRWQSSVLRLTLAVWHMRPPTLACYHVKFYGRR